MSNKTHAHHGFAAYNKFDPQGALIGNYVEERALQDTTGCHRYPVSGGRGPLLPPPSRLVSSFCNKQIHEIALQRGLVV